LNIDRNEKELAALAAYEQGDNKKAMQLENEFVAELRASMASGEDHCSCTNPCRWHGKCAECVAIHRAHRDHLPVCFHEMVNERVCSLSALTEHTAVEKINSCNPEKKR